MALVPPLAGEFATLADAIRAAGAKHGLRDAFVEGDRRLSFAEWDRASDGLAAVLVARGVGAGDVVAIMLPTSIEYALTYAAITKAGAVATGLNLRLGTVEITAILALARPSLIVIDRSACDYELPAGVLVLDRTELAAAYSVESLGDQQPTRRAADAAVIIWTSGTTGVPKGAWFDHRNLHSAIASAGVMSEPFDRKLVATPFAHAGYMAKIWDQLAWGTSVVISPTPWSAATMLQLLVRE